MTKQTNSAEYLAAVAFAAERFEQIADEQESAIVAGSMCSHDVARCALMAKDEAEQKFGVAITATLDGEWNWHFA